jgi:hypothetical protein
MSSNFRSGSNLSDRKGITFSLFAENVDDPVKGDGKSETSIMGAAMTGDSDRQLNVKGALRQQFDVSYERNKMIEVSATTKKKKLTPRQHFSGLKKAFCEGDVNLILHRFAALVRTWSHAKEPERSGMLARLANSNGLTLFITFVISANCVFSVHELNTDAVSTLSALRDSPGQRYEPASPIFTLEEVFISIYIAELVLRIGVHRSYFFAGEDFWWNVLDLLIIVFVVADVYGGSARVIRLLRMSKLLRMLRFLRFVKPLRLLVECLVGSIFHLFWCLLVFAFILFFFAMYFVAAITQHAQQYADTVSMMDLILFDKHFGDFITGLRTLYFSTTGGNDWSVYYETVAITGWTHGAMYLFFIGFFQIAVLNVVTSVFVESVMETAQPDAEDRLLELQTSNNKFAADFYLLCRGLVDADELGEITYAQFHSLLKNAKVRDMLAVRGVDIHETRHFFDMIAMQEDGMEDGHRTISLEMLAAVCMRSKGVATSVDLLTARYDSKKSLVKVIELQRRLLGLYKAHSPLPSLRSSSIEPAKAHHGSSDSIGVFPVDAMDGMLQEIATIQEEGKVPKIPNGAQMKL